MRRIAVGIAAALGVILVTASLVTPSTDDTARAVTASQWNAGLIVSDAQFYNGAAMSTGEVQAFLNARVPVCDTWHPSLAGNPQPPFTCLKDYVQSTPAMAATRYCGAIPASGARSAAEIITVVGAACNISQKALIVLLQKEQSLITDTWPWPSQYQKATGFSCPDTAPCDPAYSGFFYQVYYGARMFQRYRLDPEDFNFRSGGTYQILWSPNDCGSSQVTIQNAATAGLYNYTPYQPNAASLANMYGVGDVCSTYGNRNFWRLWWDWFGDPTVDGGGLPGVVVDRIGGADRFETAAKVSAAAFPTPGVPVVYVANGLDFPDALAAAPAAASLGGPVILVTPTSVPAASAAELDRLDPQRIVVVGDTPSVSQAVLDSLAPYTGAGQVSRVSGADRWTTSATIALDAFDAASTTLVYIATGEGYPDAIAGSASGGTLGVPVLLVPGSGSVLPQATIDALVTFDRPLIRVLGGPTTVSEALVNQLVAYGVVTRTAGADRYETALALAELSFPTSVPERVFIASGMAFPDALVGASLATSTGGALITSPSSCVTQSIIDYLVAFGEVDVTLLGSEASLTQSVAQFRRC